MLNQESQATKPHGWTHRSLFTLWDASWWFPSFTLHDISTPPHASRPSLSATSNQRSNRRFPARYRGCVPQSAVQKLPQHRRCDAPEWRRWANLHLWRHPRNGSLQLLSGTETKVLPPSSKFQRSCWSKIQFGPHRPLRCWIGNNAATLVLLDLLLSDFWRASYSHIDWDPLCEALGVEPQNGRQLRVPRPDLAAGHSSLRRFLASKSNVEVHPGTLAVEWPGYEPLAVGFPASEASETPQRSKFRHPCSWRGPQSSRSTTGPKQFPPWHPAAAAATTWGLMYWWRRHLSPSFGETVATWRLGCCNLLATSQCVVTTSNVPCSLWNEPGWCGVALRYTNDANGSFQVAEVQQAALLEPQSKVCWFVFAMPDWLVQTRPPLMCCPEARFLLFRQVFAAHCPCSIQITWHSNLTVIGHGATRIALNWRLSSRHKSALEIACTTSQESQTC